MNNIDIIMVNYINIKTKKTNFTTTSNNLQNITYNISSKINFKVKKK